jgi:hypothetical protein
MKQSLHDKLAGLKPLDGESLASFRFRRPGLYNTVLGLLCFGLFCSNVVQGVFFKRMADDIETAPYFLLLFCSTLFVLVFGSTMVVRWVLDIIKNKLANSQLLFKELLENTVQRTRVSHAWLAIIGVLDSINGLILLFAASRTAPMLHPILAQAVVLLTYISSYLLRTRRLKLVTFGLDSLATTITMAGVCVSIIPIFVAIANNPTSITSSAIWPLVFLAGVIPGAIMNVVQEKATSKIKNAPDFDYLHMLTWVSIYQVITDVVLFWSNFVNPGVPIHNLGDLGNAFDQGFACLGGKEIIVNGTIAGNCHYAALDTTMFVSGYVGTYVFSAFTINLSSSILTAMTNAPVTPAVDLVFWLAGMDKITWHIALAIPLMLVGAIIQAFSDNYRDKQQAQVEADETTNLLSVNA